MSGTAKGFIAGLAVGYVIHYAMTNSGGKK
jgi:hypothetical protein